MKLKKFFLCFFVAIISFTLIISCSSTNKSYEQLYKIQVISTNDIHGRMESNEFNKEAGIQSIDGYLQTQNYDLLLDGGDLIQGTSLNDIDQGKTIAKITSLMGYDALAIGNHEFDFGLDNLINIINEEQNNFLSANIRYKQNKKRVFTSSKIKTIQNNLKVGIIGLTTEETSYKTHPKNVKDIEFTNLLDETISEVDNLENQNINFIVLVAHVGEYATIPLAKKINNKIDLIIDGHSHEDVFQKVGNTYIIQTGEYTKALRKSNFVFNSKTGFIENFKSDLINYNELIKYKSQTNKNITDLINRLKTQEQKEFEEIVVKNSPFKLNGERNLVRYKETNLGNLVTDALYWKAKEVVSDVNFAITNSGGIRKSLPQGKITKKDTYNVSPFGNKLVVIEITGKTLKEALDWSVINNNGSGALLQISSNLKLEQQKNNSWIYKIKENNEFKILDINKKYKVALQDFTQNGGDGYHMFKEARELMSGIDIKKILEEFLQTLSYESWNEYREEFPNKRIIFN